MNNDILRKWNINEICEKKITDIVWNIGKHYVLKG